MKKKTTLTRKANIQQDKIVNFFSRNSRIASLGIIQLRFKFLNANYPGKIGLFVRAGVFVAGTKDVGLQKYQGAEVLDQGCKS